MESALHGCQPLGGRTSCIYSLFSGFRLTKCLACGGVDASIVKDGMAYAFVQLLTDNEVEIGTARAGQYQVHSFCASAGGFALFFIQVFAKLIDRDDTLSRVCHASKTLPTMHHDTFAFLSQLILVGRHL